GSVGVWADRLVWPGLMAWPPNAASPPSVTPSTPAITFQRGTVIRLLLPRGRAPGETRGPSAAAGAIAPVRSGAGHSPHLAPCLRRFPRLQSPHDPATPPPGIPMPRPKVFVARRIPDAGLAPISAAADVDVW